RRRSALRLARWRREKFLHLLPRKDQRQLFLELWQLHFSDRITPKSFPSGEKLIKSAQRRELQPHVRTRLPAFHDCKEVISKIVGRAFSPRRFVLRAETCQRLAVRLERAW